MLTEVVGIIIVKGRVVILKDMEGKQLGKTANYSASTLSDLVNGSTLDVATYELEVNCTEVTALSYLIDSRTTCC